MSDDVDAIMSGIAQQADLNVDTACEVILQHIRPEQADLIRALCMEHGLRPSHYILSYCRLAHERGETSSMIDERVRYDRDTASAPTRTVLASGQCEYCGRPFAATRPSQRFCPDREDGLPSCGRLWTLEHQIRPARPRHLTDPLAPVPPSSPHVRNPMMPATENALSAQAQIAELRAQMADLRQVLLSALRPPEPVVPDRPLS